jgi:ATP-dependent Clp protease protease subunit
MHSNFQSEVSLIERKMLDRRQILVGVPIDDKCANATIAKLLYLNQQDLNTPITLFINSPGGSITATLPIFDTIEFVDPPVHTYGMAHVNGAALWLLAAGDPGRRCVQEHSHLTIEATRVESYAPDATARLPDLNSTLAKLLASKTRLTDQEVLFALRTGRSFTASEAITAGIADSTFDASP